MSHRPSASADGHVGSYGAWILDYNHRLGLHDECVGLLATDVSARTDWTVMARNTPGFDEPTNGRHAAVDVRCERGERSPLCIEVEIVETLVRRSTLKQLVHLVTQGMDARVAIVADPREHGDQMDTAARLLRAAGLRLPVVAVAPREGVITGADWHVPVTPVIEEPAVAASG